MSRGGQRTRCDVAAKRSAVMVVAVLAILAPHAAAQVYKCADKAGRVTYQQQPCPEAQKGTRMDLPGMAVPQDDAGTEWSAKASRREVGIGMPRAYVVQAYGTPQEMRPGKPPENAAEVWRYRRKDLELDLGFNRGVVAWVKDNPDAAEAVPDPEPSRRKNFFAARPCAELAAEAGAPAAIKEELDETLARLVKRHVWEAEPGDREQTIVTCVDGVAVRVERIPLQQPGR